jgi:hypothetical protein
MSSLAKYDYFFLFLLITSFIIIIAFSVSNTHSWRTKFQLIDVIFLPHVHFHNDDVFSK